MDYPINDYCMVRAADAGVFAGTLAEVSGDVVRLTDARRIYYWQGAATLSELATRGTSIPSGCKFPAAVPVVTVRGWVEIIPITPEARATIDSVPIWSA